MCENYSPLIIDVFKSVLNILRLVGWLRYGNLGSWRTIDDQQMPDSYELAEFFNAIAIRVLRGHSPYKELFMHSIRITDAYWLTVSRPDHRECDELLQIQKKIILESRSCPS